MQSVNEKSVVNYVNITILVLYLTYLIKRSYR